MSKIERRKITVKLYPGNYASRLSALRDDITSALIAEESAPKRANTRSRAAALAREHDKLQTEAEEVALNVEVREISNIAWQRLADEHPPREQELGDQRAGMNIKTFPAALLRAALGDTDLDLDEMSRAHYMKLERAAWDLHNEGGDFPKVSAVSLLKQAKDTDSKPPPDSE